jgi:OOP family OmpA-OmpF porin
MNKSYKDTGMTRYEVAKNTLIERNEYFPDLGYNFGFYLYTPWTEIYPMQKYDREKFAAALTSLPEKPTGPTMTTDGLKRLENILKPLQGKTTIFLYTDGSDTNTGAGRKKPAEIAQALAKKYNVCFYVITTNDDYYSSDLLEKAPKLNFCSRVIGFEQYIEYPSLNSEALYRGGSEKLCNRYRPENRRD